MLNPRVFTQLRAVMGPLHLDLFASRLTCQLPWFYSWRPDLEAAAVDAFTQDWSQGRGYANPPWCLILRCLTQIKLQWAQVLLIAPSMEGTALVSSLARHARGLSQDSPQTIKPDPQSYRTGVCYESGPNSSHMAYLRDSFQSRGLSKLASQLLLASWRSKTTSNYTTPCLTSGLAGVNRGIEIPLMAL